MTGDCYIAVTSWEQLRIHAESLQDVMEQAMQREIESLGGIRERSTMVINTDASLEGAGFSWREYLLEYSQPPRL